MKTIFRKGKKEWIKKHKLHLIALAAILIIFTSIKIPFMDEPLTSDPHSTKYRTLLGSPFEMVQHNDPLIGKVKYPLSLENVENLPNNEFRNIPLHNWGLYSILEISPSNKIDLNTRIFTNILGLITLILIFIYFSKAFNPSYSLLVTSLLSVSFLFNFTYFVTVHDASMILFMFASLIFLEKFFEKKKTKHLFIAGMLGGIGVNQKYSLFLILAPIAIVLIYHKSKVKIDFLSRSAFLLPLFLVPELIHILSISNLPNAPLTGTASFLVLLGITYTMYSKSNFILERFEEVSKRIIDHPISFIPLGIGLLIVSHLFLEFTGLYRFSNGFLTDKTLIFNIELYSFMIFNQFILNIGALIFLIGLFGLLLLPILKIQYDWKMTILAFLAGAGIYWITASKSIFFHVYYFLIFLIVLILGISSIIYVLTKKIEIKIGKLIFASLIIFGLVFPFNLITINANFPSKHEIRKPAKFLSQNTKPEERFIALDMNSTLLTFYTERKSVNPGVKNDTIRESIHKKGYGRVIKSYDIKYAVTSSDMDFTAFISAFTDNLLDKPDKENIVDGRSYRIKRILGQTNKGRRERENRNEKLVKKFGIENYFTLEEKVGSFKFYRISTENSSYTT